MADLYEFLRGRKVAVELVRKLEEEKIDHTVLPLVEDEELKKYIPSYGDRIAAYAYCKSKENPSDGGEGPSAERPRPQLLDQLRSKMPRRKRRCYVSQNAAVGDKGPRIGNAAKPTRRIDIGWKNFDFKTKSYHQVRQPNGGGTRHLEMEKNMGAAEILAVGTDLYFPLGESTLGKKSDFAFCVMDSQERDIGHNTITEVYEKTKHRLLHLYICSKSTQPDLTNEKVSVQDGCDTATQSLSCPDVVLIPDTDECSDTDWEPLPFLANSSEISDSLPNQDDPPHDPVTPEDRNQDDPSQLHHSGLSHGPDWPTSHETEAGTPTVVFNPVPSRRRRLQRLRSTIIRETEQTTHYSALLDTDTDGAHKEKEEKQTFEDTGSESHETVYTVLSRLASATVKERKNLVNVYRGQVLLGAMRAFQRDSFNPVYQLSVRFSGEFAIDDGGVTREFLRLLMKEISEMPIFCGPEYARMLELNSSALRTGTYTTIGKMMAYSIVHGGALPSFLSPVLVKAMIEGIDNLRPNVEDMADYNWKAKVKKISVAEDPAALSECIEELEEMIQFAGCSSLAIRSSSKDELVTDLIHFMVLGRITKCIDQFKEGLETLGVLDELRRNRALEELFCHKENTLDAASIEALFTAPNLSEPGSNTRLKEEITLSNWRDFLLDVQASEEEVGLTHILRYATGADRVPPLGLSPEPQLKFHSAADNIHGEDKSNFTYANTCANILDIPLIAEYDMFKRNMISSVKIELFTNE